MNKKNCHPGTSLSTYLVSNTCTFTAPFLRLYWAFWRLPIQCFFQLLWEGTAPSFKPARPWLVCEGTASPSNMFLHTWCDRQRQSCPTCCSHRSHDACSSWPSGDQGEVCFLIQQVSLRVELPEQGRNCDWRPRRELVWRGKGPGSGTRWASLTFQAASALSCAAWKEFLYLSDPWDCPTGESRLYSLGFCED